MTTQEMDILAPLATALPAPPEGEYFTAAQWTTLMSIMDTIIPSIHRSTGSAKSLSPTTSLATQEITDADFRGVSTELKRTVVNPPDEKGLEEFLKERPSDIPEFEDILKRTLVYYAREDSRKGLTFLLSAMNTTLGSLILTGYRTPIHNQSIEVRTNILASWRISYLPPLQAAFKTLTFLAKNIYIKTSPTFPKLSGFPRVPAHYKPGSHYEYMFIRFPPAAEPEVIETDVVIIGSGCGGSVCAKNLSEAGFRVMVVDKGYYFPPSSLPMTEQAAGIHLFENGGFEVSDDSSISVIAGSTWGGGGTINWSASLQPPSFVRKEWAQDRGLKIFETQTFQDCLDRVCSRMGVSDKFIRHNHGSEVLLEGSRRLGMACDAVPQNTGGREHSCGYCTLGCGAAEKQGPVVSWLPDAAKAGATFVEGFRAEKVLFEDVRGKKMAVGVKGIWTSRNQSGGVDGPVSEKTIREVIVKAKRVIVSCGTLWSPIVLLNSGITNPHIGHNLHLHPVNVVVATYPTDVRPWEGSILTSANTSLTNLDTYGHGTTLEATCSLPSWLLTFLNWTSGLDFKTTALKYRHMNGFISLTRDRDTGRVYRDVSGVPRIAYTPSTFDRKHTMAGVLALCRIALVSGASEVRVGIGGTTPYIVDHEYDGSSDQENSARDAVDKPMFQAWLQEVERIGNRPPGAAFACAHQMGTNRMAARERDGVVDEKGRVWGTEGLYVADASVFPSASGVNPMVTNMAICDWISRGLIEELKGEGMRSRL